MSISQSIEDVAYRAMAIPAVRFASRFPIALGQLLYRQKQRWYDEETKNVRSKVFNTVLEGNLTVRDGMFKGLKYPEFKAHGSVLIPKLVGSYEEELHPFFEATRSRKYTQIIDIGCAEGYYAVGLALAHPEAKVYAYDIDKSALDFCRRMAKLNGVEDRMEFGLFCDDVFLSRFEFTERGLIVCDVEGYEGQLFTELARQNLAHCDIIIEFHDFAGQPVAPGIIDLYKETHNYQIVDIKSRDPSRYPILQTLTYNEQVIALHERSQWQQWGYFEPK